MRPKLIPFWCLIERRVTEPHPWIRSSHLERFGRIQPYGLRCHLGAGTALHQSCSREVTGQSVGAKGKEGEWGSVPMQFDAYVRLHLGDELQLSQREHVGFRGACAVQALPPEQRTQQEPANPQKGTETIWVGQEASLVESTTPFKEGQFCLRTNPFHTTGQARGNSGHCLLQLLWECQFSDSCQDKGGIRSEEPRESKPNRWASCRWLCTGPHPAWWEGQGLSPGGVRFLTWIWNLIELNQGSPRREPGPCPVEVEGAETGSHHRRREQKLHLVPDFISICLFKLRGERITAGWANKVVSPKSKEMFKMLCKISAVRNHCGSFFFRLYKLKL